MELDIIVMVATLAMVYVGYYQILYLPLQHSTHSLAAGTRSTKTTQINVVNFDLTIIVS